MIIIHFIIEKRRAALQCLTPSLFEPNPPPSWILSSVNGLQDQVLYTSKRLLLQRWHPSNSDVRQPRNCNHRQVSVWYKNCQVYIVNKSVAVKIKYSILSSRVHFPPCDAIRLYRSEALGIKSSQSKVHLAMRRNSEKIDP